MKLIFENWNGFLNEQMESTITLRKENESLNEALLSSMEREELFNLISKLPEPVAEKMLNLYKSIESGAEKVFDPGPHSRSEEFRKKNKDPFTRVSRDLDISKFDDEIQKIKDKKY